MAGNWTDAEKTEIAKVLAVMAIIQKSYGRELDVKNTVKAWEFIMGDCPANKVVNAMQVYMRQSNDIPSPADLLKIIKPPEKQITYAEYKHALEQHALEGYPMFGYYGQVIKDYNKQQGAINETPSHYELLESRKQELPDKVKQILAITYGESE